MSVKRNELIAAANKFFQQGRWDKAIERYQQVLEIEPKNVNVFNMLGDCYLGKGGNADAFEAYQQAADILIDQGLVNKAIAIYKKVIRIYPDNVELYEKLANCYVQSGLLGEANSLFLKIADLFTKENKHQEALSAYRKIAELNPNNVLIRLKLAEMYAKQGMENEGIAEFFRIAEDYQKENQADKLIQLLMRGKKIFPKNPDFYLRLGNAFIEKGDYKGALVELKEALDQQESATTLIMLASCALKIKDKALLDENLGKLLIIDSENPAIKKLQAFQAALSEDASQAYSGLSEVNEALINEEKFDEVLANVNDFASVLGDSPELIKLQYQLYYHQDEKEEEAVEAAKKLAFHYHNIGQLEDAEKIYSQILEKFPYRKDVREGAPPPKEEEKAAVVEDAEAETKPVEMLLDEASELAQEGMFDEAIEAYDQIIASSPDCQDAYYQRALVHKRQENYQGAVADLKKFLELDESNVRVWISLGEMYSELSNPSEAASAFERAVEIDSTLTTAYNNLEKIYTELGAEEKLSWCREQLNRLSVIEVPAGEIEEFSEEEVAEPDSVVSLADEFMPQVEEISAAEIEEAVPEIAEVTEEAAAEEVVEIEVEEAVEVVSEAAEETGEAVAQVPEAEEEFDVVADKIEAAVTPPQSDTDISEIDLAAAGEAEPVGVASEDPTHEIDLGVVEPPVPEVEEEVAVTEAVPAEEPVAEEPELEEEVMEFGEDAEVTLEALEQARIFFNHHIYSKALAECRKVLEIDPENVEAKQILLQIKEKGVSPEDDDRTPAPAFDGSTRAISSVEESILDHLIDEEISTPVFSESELDSKTLDEIIADFKTGVIEEGEEEDYDNHFNLGLAFCEMGLYDEAIGEFQIAAKDESNYLRCCNVLGECYMEKGIYSLAVEELSNGLEMARDIQDIQKFRYQLAIAYEKDGQMDKAIEMYQNVADEDTTYEKVSTRLDLAKKAKEGQA